MLQWYFDNDSWLRFGATVRNVNKGDDDVLGQYTTLLLSYCAKKEKTPTYLQRKRFLKLSLPTRHDVVKLSEILAR